jgi:hypothetical protein
MRIGNTCLSPAALVQARVINLDGVYDRGHPHDPLAGRPTFAVAGPQTQDRRAWLSHL